VRGHVAAVETDAADGDPFAGECLRDGDDRLGAALGVVRVDEEHGAVAVGARKREEGVDFPVVRLHERVGHRPVQRNAEAGAGEHGRGSGEACDVRRARREQARFEAVRAPQPEIDEKLVRSGDHASRRLRGDRGFEVQEVHQPRLDELRLGQGRDDPKQRLVAEDDRPLGYRVDVARETQLQEPTQTLVRELRRSGQEGDLLRRKMQRLEKRQRLLETGRDHEVTALRHPSDEELESGRRAKSGGEVTLQHRELVEVGQQHVAVGFGRESTVVRVFRKILSHVECVATPSSG
jgi:hypothetical protein